VAHGLLRVPQNEALSHLAGTVVLRGCSAVSERSVPADADQCFCGSPGLDHDVRSGESRPLWITAVDLQTPSLSRGPCPDLRLSPVLEESLVLGEREADAELVVVAVGDDLVMLESANDDAGMDAGFSG
jgi:hypothetical protein